MRLRTLLALLIVSTACSDSSAPTVTEPTTTTVAPTTAPIIVVTSEGNLVTIDDGGVDLHRITDDAGPGLTYRQPVWSPDGTRLAWAVIDARRDPVGGSVFVSDADGSNRVEAPAVGPPFYLHWEPTSERVGYLASPPDGGLQLGVVDAATGTARSIATGQPLYFDWSPDGGELILHVGRDRLELLSLDGTTSPIGPGPGSFQAPAWDDDRRMVYAESRTEGGTLVSTQPDGTGRRELLTYRGFLFFTTAGNRAAFQVVSTAPDAVEAMAFASSTASLAQANPQSLSVVDLETGDVEVIGPNSAGFFWNGDGSRLLFLTLEDIDNDVWFHWNVWDGQDVATYPRFRPTVQFGRDYLPFFDQYGHSIRLWNPAGDAFVYAGQAEDGTDGVWIQQTAPGIEPVLVADGILAFWAPG